MDALNDLLHKRAEALDVGRQDELQLIQLELDRLFDSRARATHLDHTKGTLTIGVPDSSTATVVRFGQLQIFHAIKDLTRKPVARIRITVL